MKKIIILSLVAATHMFAFEVSEAEIISKNDQTYSKVNLGDTSFEYASSKDNKAKFTQKYCENGDEGYSVVLANDNVDFKMKYDSCTEETSVIRPPKNAKETAANIIKSYSKSITVNGVSSLDFIRNYLGIYESRSMALTFDENGNFIGVGILLADVNGDGKNDYTTYDLNDFDNDLAISWDLKKDINFFKNNGNKPLNMFNNVDLATGFVSKVKTGCGTSIRNCSVFVKTYTKENFDRLITYGYATPSAKEGYHINNAYNKYNRVTKTRLYNYSLGKSFY